MLAGIGLATIIVGLGEAKTIAAQNPPDCEVGKVCLYGEGDYKGEKLSFTDSRDNLGRSPLKVGSAQNNTDFEVHLYAEPEYCKPLMVLFANRPYPNLGDDLRVWSLATRGPGTCPSKQSPLPPEKP
ncbi:MAG: peptidase inhibitor family I36 protein [Egibacteraceae bacterium]